MTMIASPSISVIITTHDEGHELHQTLKSVEENTRGLREVIVVDDGSSDGSCEAIASDVVRVIRNKQRIGVAYSRDIGSRVARGDVLCYLDAHQRVSKRCLDRCATVAQDRRSITCPDIRGYRRFGRRHHGAEFRLCPEHGYFSADWRMGIALRRIASVTGLRAPPYLIPRSLYPSVAWSKSLRGWGASEASLVVKSFFIGISIWHLAGPLARHRFQTTFSYSTTWEEVWRNQAIVARVCFNEATWFCHWLPRVFDPHLTDEARKTIESAELLAEHEDFQRRKTRTDRQFWTELVRTDPPTGI